MKVYTFNRFSCDSNHYEPSYRVFKTEGGALEAARQDYAREFPHLSMDDFHEWREVIAMDMEE